MTTIEVFYKDNFISQIKVAGHALFAEHGEDVVCASISSLTIYTYNLLKCFVSETVLEIEEAMIAFSVSDSDITQIIAKQLVKSFDDLEEQYKEHVSVKKNGGE